MNTTPIYQPSTLGEPLRQGEILSNLSRFIVDSETLDAEAQNFTLELHPYAIVVSQDCDLDWDFKARYPQNLEKTIADDKKLTSILFCVVYTAQEIRNLPNFNTKLWERVKINKDERYQFFQKVEIDQDRENEGLPELTIDFKQYFTLSSEEVYYQLSAGNAKRRCRLNSPYLEHFTSRFYYFQSRIALPEDHDSEPNTKP